jgi:hypothetical protein
MESPPGPQELISTTQPIVRADSIALFGPTRKRWILVPPHCAGTTDGLSAVGWEIPSIAHVDVTDPLAYRRYAARARSARWTSADDQPIRDPQQEGNVCLDIKVQSALSRKR